MIALGCNPEDPKFGFPELGDEDLYTKNGCKSPMHQAHADMERWQEEVEILGQEFHHAIQGFNEMEAVWTVLAHNHEKDPRKKTYALKVAGMYQQMGKDAQEQFEKIGGTWPKAGVSLAHHIKSECPDAKLIRQLTIVTLANRMSTEGRICVQAAQPLLNNLGLVNKNEMSKMSEDESTSVSGGDHSNDEG
ncbi:hypothetical protein C8R45DRAFT_1165325 [Mycena sanguinolenta]|nr:hypothetical protein C8R45DRAFT_1165325 [Mycena sanguinolenta]